MEDNEFNFDVPVQGIFKEDDTELDTDQPEEQGESKEEPEEESGDTEIVIEGLEPDVVPEKETGLVRELRKVIREKDKELSQHKKAPPVQQEAPVKRGPRPKLEDFGYDDDAFDAALDAWVADGIREREQQLQLQYQQKELEKSYGQLLQNYQQKAQALGVKDFQDSHDAVVDALSIQQQNAILSGADNPAKVVYALGKYSKKLNELKAITDPLKFAAHIGALERELKAKPRKALPEPEKTVSASKSAPVSRDLDRLRKDAEKTGDWTQFYNAKRQQRK